MRVFLLLILGIGLLSLPLLKIWLGPKESLLSQAEDPEELKLLNVAQFKQSAP